MGILYVHKLITASYKALLLRRRRILHKKGKALQWLAPEDPCHCINLIDLSINIVCAPEVSCWSQNGWMKLKTNGVEHRVAVITYNKRDEQLRVGLYRTKWFIQNQVIVTFFFFLYTPTRNWRSRSLYAITATSFSTPFGVNFIHASQACHGGPL